MLKKIACSIITFYQHTISPDHGLWSYRYPYGCCRHTPTCSEYAKQAIMRHGLWRGAVRSAGRVVRCNPFNKGGYDPVE